MRFVPESWVGDMLEHRPLLLLNETRHGLSLIDYLVHRHPSLVTSKQGGKALPLELWDMIIAAALEEPRKDKYALVRPRAALVDGALICDAYNLKRIPAYERNEHYDELLEDYDGFLDSLEAENPDECEDDEVTIRKGATFAVDLKAIRNQERSCVEILFVYVGLPDIISLLEYGRCGFCGGDRSVVAGEGDRWEMDRYCIRLSLVVSAPCPDCVGEPYTTDALELAQEEDDLTTIHNVEWTDELEEEFKKRREELEGPIEERLKELGYLD